MLAKHGRADVGQLAVHHNLGMSVPRICAQALSWCWRYGVASKSALVGQVRLVAV